MIPPRGARPFHYAVLEAAARARGVDAVPGVTVRADGVWCARDSVEVVGRLLGTPPTPDELAQWDAVDATGRLGVAEYDAVFAPALRPYQPAPVAFVAARDAAINAYPCRSGKGVMLFAACALRGAKQIHVLTSGTPKLGWAEDAARWLRTWPLVLEGRRGDDAWYFCAVCSGLGLAGGNRCDVCRGRGWFRPRSVAEALASARVVVSNYDIHIAHRERDAAGRLSTRRDLPGWVRRVVDQGHADTLILDEFDEIGSRARGAASPKRSAVRFFTRSVSRVYGASATPFGGKVEKLWPSLDLISGGDLWGKGRKLFCTRYAGGHVGNYGYTVPQGKAGRTPLAELELPDRLRHVMTRKERHEIQPYMPRIDRQVVRLAPGGGGPPVASSPGVEALEAALDATARLKVGPVVDAAVSYLRAGERIACFTRRKDTGIEIHRRVAEGARKLRTGARTGAGDGAALLETWCTVGKTVDAKVAMADAFTAHEGPAFFAATIDGFQRGRTLGNVTFNFFPDLHYDVDAVQQCEERSLLDGRADGLVSLFFSIAGSSDDQVLAVVLAALDTLARCFGDSRAAELRDAYSPRETLDQIWARHVAHIRGRPEPKPLAPATLPALSTGGPT